MRRLIAVIALMALALPASAQTTELDQCLIEVRQLTSKSVNAGYPPIMAIRFLAEPTDAEECSRVLNDVSAWWARVTQEIRAETDTSVEVKPAVYLLRLFPI